MKINFSNPVLKKPDKNLLFRTVNQGWISSQGDIVKKFEKKFAKWQGSKYAVSTSNCTTALHLSLLALNIGKGDEVICTNLSFIAPANMIKLTGAKPVFVDVCMDSFAMNPETWNTMVERTRELELSLGNGLKIVERNEFKSLSVQRRSIRANLDLKKNKRLIKGDLIMLRPISKNGMDPYKIKKILGMKLKKDIKKGEEIKIKDLK